MVWMDIRASLCDYCPIIVFIALLFDNKCQPSDVYIWLCNNCVANAKPSTPTYYITKLYFAVYELFIENEFKVISFDVRLKNVVDLLAYLW